MKCIVETEETWYTVERYKQETAAGDVGDEDFVKKREIRYG